MNLQAYLVSEVKFESNRTLSIMITFTRKAQTNQTPDVGTQKKSSMHDSSIRPPTMFMWAFVMYLTYLGYEAISITMQHSIMSLTY